MINIGVAGQNGRVGTLLRKELESQSWPSLSFAGGSDRKTNLDTFFQNKHVVIDFTTPQATIDHLEHAQKNNVALIVGTTGLSDKDEQLIDKASQNIPIVYAANTSVGVNLLCALIEKAAKILEPEQFDIEINETHHRYKVDAPSGTALMLGHAAANGRGVNLNDVKVDTRSGHTGERKSGDIGFSVQRGGSVPGEHVVSFFGDEERIVISHLAHDRRLFAKGALKAAEWIHEKPAGLYTMKDVLGL